jgi:hypothetical protein
MDLQIFNQPKLLKICNIGVFGRNYRKCKFEIPGFRVCAANLLILAIPKTQTFPDDNPTSQKMESGDRWKASEFASLQTV